MWRGTIQLEVKLGGFDGGIKVTVDKETTIENRKASRKEMLAARINSLCADPEQSKIREKSQAGIVAAR